MSLALFKSNMKFYMNNQNGIDKYQDWTNKFVNEYDQAVKRGFDTLNSPIRLQTGNTNLMKTLTNIACMNGLAGNETFYNDLGKAIVGYWTGAQMSLFPPPILPAPGSIQNITTNVAPISIPGTWKPGKFRPTNSVDVFLDKLIAGIQQHLGTVGGEYYTTSLYPGSPPFPAPGVVKWQGYTIPPAAPTPPTPSQPSLFQQLIEKVAEVFSSDNSMSQEQTQAAQAEKNEADSVANDSTLPQSGRSTASEYSKLKQSEISSGKMNAVPVELSEEELQQIEDNVPDVYKCPAGTRVVAIAKKDIGILETGTPPGKNYGGFAGGVQKDEAGRIDEMFTNVGLDNQAKVRKDGSGYYWCAAAVATWWQEAGLPTPSGGASCDNWMNWGKQNGYWSTTPKVGAAVLYGTSSDAHHIGIVSAVTETGGVITIEGNTSGGGFNRNGCGVFTKTPKRYLGFVLPPECAGS